jgi:hypothetical protein
MVCVDGTIFRATILARILIAAFDPSLPTTVLTSTRPASRIRLIARMGLALIPEPAEIGVLPGTELTLLEDGDIGTVIRAKHIIAS